MNTYNIGPLTMRYVFERAELQNVSDWQAVMDAVEDALKLAYPSREIVQAAREELKRRNPTP